MGRPIVTDPNKFDGAPHIEGTLITVAQVQEYWRRPRIGAQQARSRFPELTEDELGAAVTYAPPREPDFAFVAESQGPPRRRIHIWSEQVGWMFSYDDLNADGVEQPGWDTWEETWDRILLYPNQYAPASIVWRDEKSGEVVDIYALNPKHGE